MTTKTDEAALEPLLTIERTAEILGCSVKTVHRRIAAGDLPVIEDGRNKRVHPGDLRRYIASRRKF